VPIFRGDHVTDDAGTGFVHTAPSHGDDDYIPRPRRAPRAEMTHNVLDDSSFRARPAVLRRRADHRDRNGKEGDANKRVIDKLVEVGGLLARGRIKHSYPHSLAVQGAVIPQHAAMVRRHRPRPSATGRTHGRRSGTRAQVIDELVQVDPANRAATACYSMIEARPDWVLSRQRAWGVPLTCFVKKGAAPDDPDFLLRDPAVNARILEAFEAEGADAWYKPGAKARFLATTMTRRTTSRSSTSSTCGSIQRLHPCLRAARPPRRVRGRHRGPLPGRHRPASRLVPFLDAAGLRHHRARALPGVLTHGFTLDEKGMKMSKSLGNTVAPEEVVKQYGADILRLWVAQSDYTADQRIGPEILKGVADSYRRLRNTMRFMLGSLADFSEADRVEPADMPELERWVLHRLAELDAEGARGLRAPMISRACSRRCSTSPPRTCRPSISTSARTRSIATRRTACGGARRARCWTSCSTG
jgi:isoleucyl-tRNA synthetase